MKLPLAAYVGLPEQAPRKRSFAVTYFSHVDGPGVTVRVGTGRFKERADAVRAAEALDHRLLPQITLVEDTP